MTQEETSGGASDQSDNGSSVTTTTPSESPSGSPRREHRKKKQFRSALVPIKPVSKVCSSAASKVVPSSHDSAQFASRILPWLYLGCAQDAAKEDALHDREISHIVNLSPEARVGEVAGITYLFVEVSDHSDQPILGHFNRVFDFIEGARLRDGRVLVHCRFGVSRSATLVIAYLMRSLSIPLVLAKDIVKQNRPSINPNIGFIAALSQFQRMMDIDSAKPLVSYQDRLKEWSLSSALTEPGAEPEETTPDSPQTPGSHPGSPHSPQGILCF